jgi:hypothetical protein
MRAQGRSLIKKLPVFCGCQGGNVQLKKNKKD